MNPLLLTKAIISIKKEAVLVLVVITLLFALPIVALVSVTNVGALNDPEVHLYDGPASTKNTYDYGYCTFWAAKRREEIGKAIPNTWGDAHTWDDRALRDGYLVDHTPSKGAVMESDAGELGHVAFVEEVAPDGGWTISEMNVKGWDILDNRTMPAATAAFYNFIH
jgi:surface antigen